MGADPAEITSAVPRFCTECGQLLPAPGERCPSCPQLDARRREIVARYRDQLDELRAVDADENAKALRDAAAAARAVLAPVQEGTAPLEAAVQRAVAAERGAADSLRQAESHLRKVTRAEERAQRDQASPEAQTEALLRRRAAADVVQRFRAVAEGAAAARRAAEQELAGHLARLAALEDAAVAAERAAENPPAQVPPSVWTALLAHPLQVLLLPDLGAEARALAGAQVVTLAGLAGVDTELRDEGRAALEAELADRTRRAAFVQPLGNGNVGIVPNPLNPQTPQAHGPLGQLGPAGPRP